MVYGTKSRPHLKPGVEQCRSRGELAKSVKVWLRGYTVCWTTLNLNIFKAISEQCMCMWTVRKSFIDFVCFCGFWMLFDPCLRNWMLWTYLAGVLFVSLSWRRFIRISWKNVFEAWELFEVVWDFSGRWRLGMYWTVLLLPFFAVTTNPV